MKNIVSFNKYHLNESVNWKELVNRAQSSEDGFHQAILNAAYDGFNAHSPDVFDFTHLIEWTIANMGEEFALLVFLGKYNQQVTNGGHLQYHDNGYDGSVGDRDEDFPLHQEMIHLFKKLGYDKLPLGDKVLDIMSKYEVHVYPEDCEDCGGSGYYEEDDDEEDDDEELWEGRGGSMSCGACGGSGESRDNYTTSVDDDLDTKYYVLEDDWMKTLGVKAKEISIKEVAKLDNPDITDDDLKDTMHMFL